MLLALAVIAWGFVSWFLAERLTAERLSRQIEHEQDLAASAAATVGASVGRTLAHMRSIPKVIAKDPEILAALLRMGSDVQRSALPRSRFRESLENDPDLSRAARRFESTLVDLDIDQILVMNAAGDCIVSSGFPTGASPNGVNYLDREYFQMAKRDGSGRQFAVGRTSNAPGIFYSSAVIENNRFLGVVIVKIEVSRLSRMVDNKNIFITDEYGVIIVAGDESLYMKAIPGAKVAGLAEAVQEGRYKRHAFGLLDIRAVVEEGVPLLRLEGRAAPLLQATSDTQSDILKVWAFRDMSELGRIRDDGQWVFFLLFLAGTSIIASGFAGVVHLRRSEEHQAEIAAINAELVKLNNDLQIQARFDALTGCVNRRHFLEGLGIELKRAMRFELPCCMAMLDIDHFKAVNDQYGHAAGDALLQHFAQTVRNCLRATDLLGRLGGEEFALFMPQTPLAGGLKLAERVRRVVELSSVQFAQLEIRCAVSIGVVEWCGRDESLQNFIARADDAMYVAKHTGRNRVYPPAAVADSGSVPVAVSGEADDHAHEVETRPA